MKLIAAPFDAKAGNPLPRYRAAYVHGGRGRCLTQDQGDDLRHPAGKTSPIVAHCPHSYREDSASVAAGWVGQPVPRSRKLLLCIGRRALSLGLACLLLAGAARANNRLPSTKWSGARLPLARLSASVAGLLAAPKAPMRFAAASGKPGFGRPQTIVLHGRILNERGLPLVGATVLQRGTAHGTSTDTNGNYSLRVPAGRPALLQYGYGGYMEQEVSAAIPAAAPVVLQPKEEARKQWWFFRGMKGTLKHSIAPK